MFIMIEVRTGIANLVVIALGVLPLCYPNKHG